MSAYLTKLAVAALFTTGVTLVAAQASGSGTTTRYWDCCKPSCAWNDLSTLGIDSAVKSCNAKDQPLSDTSAASGCSGGTAYMCSDQSPWAVSSDVAYGFAAVSASSPKCCQCYKLSFTSGAASGKTMIVQATNTGSDVSSTQFDLAMPGGGFGIFDACTSEWGATSNIWGAQYGGSSTDTCSSFPAALQPGCNFRWGDFFQGSDNPTVDWEEVSCPAAITAKSGCVRTGDSPSGPVSASSAAPAPTSTSLASSSAAAPTTSASTPVSNSSAAPAPTSTSLTSSSATAPTTSASTSVSTPATSSSSAVVSSAAPASSVTTTTTEVLAPSSSSEASLSTSTTPTPTSAEASSSTSAVPSSEPTQAKLDKLSILGVRSFDNIRSETIQFYAPLTLIVGYNGSGKTTIIECLKYATTGEQPPNSKGGAFIHDPKLCGEREVLAQVKMSFKSTSGAKMVVTRSLQLTEKPASRTMKTLEGQLLMVKDGERTAISSRVAELDQIMPQYLGVSKAILENVIFCHQDESLWPMSEPSALKKKFDEIFEALKYTKAIANIKDLRKKQVEELGKYRISETHAKEDKDKADKAEKQSRALHAELETLRAETTELHRRARDAGDKATEAGNRAAAYTEVVESLKAARTKQNWYEDRVTELARDLKERKESDEVLQSELDQYGERVAAHKQRQEEEAQRYDSVKREIASVRSKQSDNRVEAGKHQQRKANHEQQIRNRESEIKESARKHGIRGFDDPLDDRQITQYMDRIVKLSKDQNTKFERLRRDNAAEVAKIQGVLDNLRDTRSALQAGKQSAKEQITASDRRVAALHEELDRIEIDEGGKALIESKIEETEENLSKARDSMKQSAWQVKIKESEAELKTLDEAGTSLNQDLIQATKHAGSLAKIDHLKKECKERQRSLATMKGAHADRISAFLGPEWQSQTLEADFQRVVEVHRKQLLDAEKQRDGTTREVEQVQYKLETVQKDLETKRGEHAEAVLIIKEKAEDSTPEEFMDTLKAFQEDRDTRKDDVDGFSHLKDYLKSGIDIASSDENRCKLCDRKFESEIVRKRFINNLKKLISPKLLDESQKQLKEFEARLELAREAQSQYDTWKRLENEIPELESIELDLETFRNDLRHKVEQQDRVVSEYEEAKRDVESLTKPVANIVKYFQEVETLQQQIAQLTSNQKDSGLSRTLEDIQEEIESLRVKSRDMRSTISKYQAGETRHRTQIISLESELGRLGYQLGTAKRDLERQASLVLQIDELKKSRKERQDGMIELDQKLQTLGAQFAEQELKRDDLKQRCDGKERELQQDTNALSDSVRSLQFADSQIRSYIESGGPLKLDQCQRDIHGYDQEIQRSENELKQITIVINKIIEELSNHESTRRIINDNLSYRKMKRDLDTIKAEIEHLRNQNAEADQDNYRRQQQKWHREQNLLHTEETSKLGIMKAKDDQLVKLIEDWETDYKDAAQKFKEAHIRVETTKAAVEDLARYGGALDKAIMKYHSLKMAEINTIIAELWKKTYQGTDIDAILIRSDSAGTNSAGAGAAAKTNNRSYNYRVSMVKSDVEMDMRGRCSAGQKVLASIIIRLALAECFGVNCGLIALDEPTTNLDRDNIKSLAESLHEIIKFRRQQNNFQLIVITHDEEFLRFMKCADFCDEYWRVSRSDRQKSIIERQSIAVMV